MDKSLITIGSIQKAYAYMGYDFFTEGDYNLNIFGIRSADLQSDRFNDYVGLAYKENNSWVVKAYAATTDPGSTYRKRCIDSKGTAIMIPGQYKGAYGIGLHKNSYEALRQKKPMKYWRDSNSNGQLDLGGKIFEDLAYTNIHRATNVPGGVSQFVQGYSAGCQVIASYNDFAEFMQICNKGKGRYGNSFTYTLFTENNFLCKDKKIM